MAMSGNGCFLRILLIIGYFWGHSLWAGELVGELDKTQGNTADRFVYTLSIDGNFKGQPDFPAIDGVTIQQGGREESTQIFNGNYSRTVRLRYILTPTHPGTFEIPEITLTIDGKVERTLPLAFTVKEIDPAEQRKQKYFVEREVSKDSVYEGEVFSITDRIFVGASIDGRPQVAPLELPAGFRVFSLDSSNSYSKNIAGTTFQVIEQRYFVIADSSGEFAIPPFVAQVSVPQRNNRRRRNPFDFFGQTGVPKRMQSPARPIEVLPLPTEGRSSNFSGLVGEFGLDVEVTPRQVEVGGNVTVTAEIKGIGETENMESLNLEADQNTLKIYKDKPIDGDTLDYNKGIIGKREFKFAVVPHVTGTKDLGSLSVDYFDPHLKQYKTLHADLGAIDVSAMTTSAKKEDTLPIPMSSPQVKKTEIAQLGSDILGLHSAEQLMSHDSVEGTVGILLTLVLIGGGGLVIVSYVLSIRRLTQDERRMRTAYRQAFKRYQDKKQMLQSKKLNTHELAKSLESTVKEYLADRLMVTTDAMTIRDLEQLLKGRHIHGEDVAKFIQLLQEIDRVKYSPEAKLNLESFLSNLESLLLKLEKQC